MAKYFYVFNRIDEKFKSKLYLLYVRVTFTDLKTHRKFKLYNPY